jgi:hypothetical protein
MVPFLWHGNEIHDKVIAMMDKESRERYSESSWTSFAEVYDGVAYPDYHGREGGLTRENHSL